MVGWRAAFSQILTKLGELKTAIQNGMFFELVNSTMVKLKAAYTELILGQIAENRQRHKWDLAITYQISAFNLTKSILGGEVDFVLADGYPGGMLEGFTGGTNGAWVGFDTVQKVFEQNMIPEFTFWLEINDVSESNVKIGFYKDADEYCLLQVIGGDIHILSNDGGVGDDIDTGSFILDDNQVYFKLRIEDSMGKLYKKTSPTGAWTFLGEGSPEITMDYMMIRGEILAGSATNCRLRTGRLEVTQEI